MKLFMRFGGAAPMADDEAAAEQAAEAACRRGKCAGRKFPLLTRWGRFLPGNLKGKMKKKRPSSSPVPPPEPPAVEAKTKRGTDMDDSDGGGDVFGASTASLSSSCSSRMSSASMSSLYSYYYSSPSSTPARSSSFVSCSLSPTAWGVPERYTKESLSTSTSPAAGAAAVVLCLLLVVFRGRVGATLLTPTALYLFPRRWPAKAQRDAAAAALDSLQRDAEEETPGPIRWLWDSSC